MANKNTIDPRQQKRGWPYVTSYAGYSAEERFCLIRYALEHTPDLVEFSKPGVCKVEQNIDAELPKLAKTTYVLASERRSVQEQNVSAHHAIEVF
jgi:hypothetical protein